jgi:hypothetical protein
VILCSSRLRPPVSLGPDRIVRLGSEAGFDGLAADAGCPLSLLKLVAFEGLRSSLPVRLAGCPLPEAELGKGKRPPYLAAMDDPEERLAALALGRNTLERGTGLDIRLFALDLGPVGLRTAEAELRLRFARREMDEDEPGGRLLQRALAERRARAERILDACRLGLEPLLREAERRNATLLVPVAATPWQLPSPREVDRLVREFSGAPLRLVLCPARRAVLQQLALGGPSERWDDLERQAGALLATDQVGLETDLLLGTGELDEQRVWPSGADAALPGVISGPLDAAFKEVLRARRRLEGLRPAAAEPSPTPAS